MKTHWTARCRLSPEPTGLQKKRTRNIVAAEILLDSDEILEYIYDYGYTSEQIARAMHTDINLVALKIAHLAETGHQLRRMEYRSSFLK